MILNNLMLVMISFKIQQFGDEDGIFRPEINLAILIS